MHVAKRDIYKPPTKGYRNGYSEGTNFVKQTGKSWLESYKVPALFILGKIFLGFGVI